MQSSIRGKGLRKAIGGGRSLNSEVWLAAVTSPVQDLCEDSSTKEPKVYAEWHKNVLN